jgi:hypothetical protein
MGDLCDMNDLERFMRSPEGQSQLAEIQQQLEGRRIGKVTFSNEVHCIGTTLELDDDTTFYIVQPSLEVDAIREQFEKIIEREYYSDFPHRKQLEVLH